MPNINKNHYNGVPKLHVSRSRFRPDHVETKTTWNNGDLIPLRTFEVYPGDTFDISVNSFIRELTLLNPVMDDLYMNIWAFFCPNRLVLDSWKEVIGVNNSGAWLPQSEVSVPFANIGAGVNQVPGTLWDYFQAVGGTAAVNSTYAQVLKLRMYYKIWNDHFRFQPLQVPVLEDTSLSTKTVSSIVSVGGTSYNLTSYPNAQAFRDAIEAANPTWVPQALNTGLYPLHVCRIADYWSTCLPAPVAESVKIPGIVGDTSYPYLTVGNDPDDPDNPYISSSSTYTASKLTGANWKYISEDGDPESQYKGGFLIGSADNATIAGLRQAIALTHFLENDALYGFKNEKAIILGHYGVDNGDARVQLSEYLGGFSFVLHQSQVAQTSATGVSGTAQGNLAAYTQQFNSSHLCRYSATEHGYIFILGATRTNRSYSQGIDPSLLRLEKFDFYWPEFANISDSPVYSATLFNSGGDPKMSNIFGYQEPFADLRWLGGSQVTGFMRPSFSNSFESYSYADEYTTAPTLSDSWIRETAANVDRTLAVSSRVTHQFLGDFYFDVDVYRPMPVYGKPGLLRI